MFEVKPDVYLRLSNPNLTIESFEFYFDYDTEESLKLFEQNYKFKNLKLDENFKKVYPTFFHIEKLDDPDRIHFMFEFGRFCNFFGITYEEYRAMVKKHHNLYPFPIIGKFTIKDGNNTIECPFRAETLHGDSFVINYSKNDIFLIKYVAQDECQFKLHRDLSAKELKFYEDYLMDWK